MQLHSLSLIAIGLFMRVLIAKHNIFKDFCQRSHLILTPFDFCPLSLIIHRLLRERLSLMIQHLAEDRLDHFRFLPTYRGFFLLVRLAQLSSHLAILGHLLFLFLLLLLLLQVYQTRQSPHLLVSLRKRGS